MDESWDDMMRRLSVAMYDRYSSGRFDCLLDEAEVDGGCNLSLCNDGLRRPYRVVSYLSGGRVENLFDVVERSMLVVMVVVFKGEREMLEYDLWEERRSRLLNCKI